MDSAISTLADLRCRIAACAPSGRGADNRIALGHAGLDRALDPTGGRGLSRGRLHEILALSHCDAPSAAAFAALVGHLAGGPLIWLREERAERRLGLHPPGLNALGLDPARLVLAILPDCDSVLRAGADVLRCPAAGVALIELAGNPRSLDLTAMRRFQLAAEASGATALLLRCGAKPSAGGASTRWILRSAASAPLEANAPGAATFVIELARNRGGPTGCWTLEWDRDVGRFQDLRQRAALDGPVACAPVDRPVAADLTRRRTA